MTAVYLPWAVLPSPKATGFVAELLLLSWDCPFVFRWIRAWP
jgi:hypothetical protein